MNLSQVPPKQNQLYFGAYSSFHSTIYGDHDAGSSKSTLGKAVDAHAKEINNALPKNVKLDFYAGGRGVIPFLDGFPADAVEIRIYAPEVDAYSSNKAAPVNTLKLKRKPTFLMMPFSWMSFMTRLTRDNDYRESANDFVNRAIATVKAKIGSAQPA